MDATDQDRLVELLTTLRTHGRVAPHLPEPVWRAVAGVVPVLAVEIMVTRTGADLLLVRRENADWHGWHIPGGYLGCGESTEDACRRIAHRELGVEVTMDRLLGVFTWPNHPYANAVSLLCVCHAHSEVIAGEYFTEAPDDLVPNHNTFAAMFFRSGADAT